MSNVLVLPGTIWQIPLMQKLKEFGHKVFLVNPERHEEVLPWADFFFESDIFAVDTIEKYAIQNHIKAVISDECDIAMPVVAELGRRLKVDTLSSDAAALYTDKFRMREFCACHGFRTPEYKLCGTVEDAIAFFMEMDSPIIIKPLDSNASHGVFKIETAEEARQHFAEAMSFSRVQKAVIAERFIEGTEFTIDGVKTPNSHYTLAISEKKHFKHNPNIANELYFTHSSARFDYERLRKANDAFVMASPLVYGFTHAEYKCEDGEFYLIEIGARGGGNMISSVITQFMSGYDTYRYLIDCSLGSIFEKEFSICGNYRERAAVLKFFDVPHGGGKVLGIEGEDYLNEENDIRAYKFNFNVGDTIEDAKNDSVRVGFYIACSENEMKLRKIMDMVDERFRIIVQ